MKIGHITGFFSMFSTLLSISEHIGECCAIGNTINFKQHHPWNADILSIPEMVKNKHFFKYLEKMKIENQISKFTATNFGSFGVFWGSI